jgi:hypothetical protein
MTSPYLHKPRRTLDEAEADRARGHGAEAVSRLGDAGDGSPRLGYRSERGRPALGGPWYALGIGAILVGGALAGMIALSDPRVATDPSPDAVIEIAPAAGPTEGSATQTE